MTVPTPANFTVRLADLRSDAMAFTATHQTRIQAACAEIDAAIRDMEAAGLGVRRRYPIGVNETLTTGFRAEVIMEIKL